MAVIEEAISRISELAIEAAEPKIINLPGLRPEEFAVMENVGDGLRIHIRDKSAPVRTHTAGNLSTFVAMVNDLGSEVTRVYLGERQITAVLDHANGSHRVDMVTLGLPWTNEYTLMKRASDAARSLAAGADPKNPAAISPLTGITQGKLDLLLRTTLRAYEPHDFGAAVRSIQFKQQRSGQTTVAQGRESMDADIKNELVGINGDAMPEEVSFNLRVFERAVADWDLLKVHRVTCAFSINVQEMLFTITPLDGAVGQAMANALDEIGARLREELKTVTVYGVGAP